MTRERVVVVGASLAGITVAGGLRSQGYDGRISVVGEESVGAYNRPALSKGVLAGSDGPDDIALPALPGEIEQRLRTQATGLDVERRRVLLADGDDLEYDKLVIATGARARRMSDLGAASGGVQEITFRDLDDALSLARALRTRPRVVIVGAGFLGMELASACVARGAAVTVLDQQPPLRRQLGPYLADLLSAAARRHGVGLVHHPGGVKLHGTPGSPAAELADGRRFEGDLVLSVVGCVPNIEWLRGSGLPVDGGVHVDERCRVSANVVAAGDVVAFPSAAGPRRTPWWNSALEQARTAASSLLGGERTPPLVPAPYFWTEQFGITVRVCGGLPARGAPTVVHASDEGNQMLLTWPQGTAAAVNKRMPITKLRALARAA